MQRLHAEQLPMMSTRCPCASTCAHVGGGLVGRGRVGTLGRRFPWRCGRSRRATRALARDVPCRRRRSLARRVYVLASGVLLRSTASSKRMCGAHRRRVTVLRQLAATRRSQDEQRFSMTYPRRICRPAHRKPRQQGRRLWKSPIRWSDVATVERRPHKSMQTLGCAF